MNKPLKRNRRGAAVPLAMVAIVILLAMGVGLLGLGTNNRIFAARTSSKIAARSAADAGLTMALFEMNEKLGAKPWIEGKLPSGTDVKLPHCDAVCSYKVGGNMTDGYFITSVGEHNSARRTVNATLAMKGLYDNAILTKADLILKSSTVLDGYNSADASDTDTEADIATQSTDDQAVTLNSDVKIAGDVRVGLGGDPGSVIKDLGATLGGFKYAATDNETLPDIDAPATLAKTGKAISASAATVSITPADNGQYTGISLKGNKAPGVLEISGGDVELHITGNIDLGNTCEIIVKDGSTLTLYVDGDIACDNGSSIGVEDASRSAKALTLYSTGEGAQSFDLKAKNEWVGVVYAPNADVGLYAGTDAYGAIVSNTFEFKSGGDYHYDRALKTVSAEDEGVRFVITDWNEY
jgi:hypothetical protein